MMRRTRRLVLALLALIAISTVVPAAALAVTVRVNDISFADATHTYVVGGRTDALGGFASYTGDGGATWRKVLVPSRLAAVDVQSADSASAVGRFERNAWSTSNSGETWARTGSMVVNSGSLDLHDIACLPSGTLVAVGAHIGTAWGDLATIWTSADGGTTWTNRYDGPKYTSSEGEPLSSRAMLESLDFAPDGLTGWAVGTEWSVPGGGSTGFVTFKQVMVFKTTDGGLTWSPEAVPGAGSPAMSVSVRDPFSAWIATSFGAVFRNAGAGWISAGRSTTRGSRAIAIAAGADAQTAIVAGDGGVISRTTNGGSWVTVGSLPGGALARSAKMAPGGVVGFVGGDNSALLKTADGGVTWRAVSGFVPTLPKAYLTTPLSSTRMYRGRTYNAYGYLKPRHSGYPVKVYAYRYERVNGRYIWKLRHSFSARAYNYSSYTKYAAAVRLAYTGRWRLRAFHSDSAHAPTWSGYSRDIYVR